MPMPMPMPMPVPESGVFRDLSQPALGAREHRPTRSKWHTTLPFATKLYQDVFELLVNMPAPKRDRDRCAQLKKGTNKATLLSTRKKKISKHQYDAKPPFLPSQTQQPEDTELYA